MFSILKSNTVQTHLEFELSGLLIVAVLYLFLLNTNCIPEWVFVFQIPFISFGQIVIKIFYSGTYLPVTEFKFSYSFTTKHPEYALSLSTSQSVFRVRYSIHKVNIIMEMGLNEPPKERVSSSKFQNNYSPTDWIYFHIHQIAKTFGCKGY